MDGDSYHPYKKCLWYLANSLKQPTLSYKINYKTKIDNRINILAISPPASGKSTSKTKMKKFVDSEDVRETSGLCHPQQLIGKTIPATAKKAKKEIPGLLSYKFLIHDEVQDCLNEKNDLYSAVQKLKRQAMDVYGDNEIDKKLVGNMPGEETICISPTRFLDFAHPKKLESTFFDTGSFRRYFIFFLASEEELDLEALTEFKLDGKTDYDHFVKNLDGEYKNSNRKVQFTQQNLDIIAHCHATVLKFLLNCDNENAVRYGMMMRYNLRSVLSKMVFILALANNEKTPSIEITIMACRDTLLFILETIRSINELANIGTTSDVWHGASETDALALTWLLKKRAFSLETSCVSIAKFCTILANLYGCKLTQSRSHYYDLKSKGYLDSKKGKNDSRIWLKFIPKELKLINDRANDLEFLDQFKTAGSKTPLLTVLKHVFIDDKELEKAKTIGSAGLWGYILYNTCVEVDTLYYINNVYKIGVPPPILPTLLKLEGVDIDDKKEIQNGQTSKKEPIVFEENSEENTQSTRDTQYFEAKECQNIQPCSKDEVLEYTTNHPEYTITQLLEKFGPGVLVLQKGGYIK